MLFREFNHLRRAIEQKATRPEAILQQNPDSSSNSPETPPVTTLISSEPSTVKTMRTPRGSVNRPVSSTERQIPYLENAREASLQSVGGLGEVLAELRDLVTLPLKRPDWLAKLGLEPPRGVLLVGSPGTGKTLTVRALAAELNVNYIAIASQKSSANTMVRLSCACARCFKKLLLQRLV